MKGKEVLHSDLGVCRMVKSDVIYGEVTNSICLGQLEEKKAQDKTFLVIGFIVLSILCDY